MGILFIFLMVSFDGSFPVETSGSPTSQLYIVRNHPKLPVCPFSAEWVVNVCSLVGNKEGYDPSCVVSLFDFVH